MIGLSIVAWGTYELHVLTLETSHEHLIWLLTLRAAGMGIAMMPIMTGGIAAVPPAQVSRASAFNNVVQRTSAALGLAVLTAMVDRSQAQLDADQAGDGGWRPTSMLGAGPTGQWPGCTPPTSRCRPRCSSRRWTGCSWSRHGHRRRHRARVPAALRARLRRRRVAPPVEM